MIKLKKYIAICNDELKKISSIKINIYAYNYEQAEKKFLNKYKSYILIAILTSDFITIKQYF